MEKKQIILGLLCLFLVGCTNNKAETKTTVCSGTNKEDERIFVSEGDKVISQTEYDVYSWDNLGFTEADVDNQSVIDHMLASYQKMIGKAKGLEISCQVNEDEKTIVFVLTLDFTVADLKELVSLQILDASASDYVSLKASIKNVEAKGLKCQ